MRRIYLLLILLMPLGISALTVSASVNKNRLSLSDRLEYTLQIKSENRIDISEPQPPRIEGFSFVNMSSSMRSSTSIVNFRAQHEYIQKYSYSYVPLKEGTVTIPVVSIKVGNKVYTTTEIPVTVVKGSPSPSQSNPSSPGGSVFNDPGLPYRAFGDNGSTMLLTLPRKQTVYKGQPTILSYYLYTDQMVRSFNLDDEKDFPGYGKSVYEQPNSLDYEVVNYNGKRYQRALIKKIVLVPNTEGELRVPELHGSARIYEFGYMSQPLRSQDAWLEVKPLPQEDIPEDFMGAVGSFEISEDISATRINLGEAITYSLRIAGDGNFNHFGNPRFPDNAAQVSSPMVVDKLKAGIEGSRVLYYTIIPTQKGELSLAPLRFSWFDYESGTYRTYSSKPYKIEVKSANVVSYFSGLLDSGKPQTLRPMLSRDSYPTYKNYLKSLWYWLLVASILFGTAVAVFFSKQRIKRMREPEEYAKMRANKVLKLYLLEAEKAARDSSAEFYSLAENNLMRYLSDKYGISIGLSSSQKLELLADKHIPEDLLHKTRDFIGSCQLHRFAPYQPGEADIQRDLALLRQLVTDFSRLGEQR